jgi:hypothetical protein
LWFIIPIAVVIPDITNPQRAIAEVVWLSIYYGFYFSLTIPHLNPDALFLAASILIESIVA